MLRKNNAAPDRADAVGRKSISKKGASADVMYQALFDAITEHRLLPGAKLREDELAQAFAVSRTPVREVLQRLHQVGMVEIHHNRGAFVAKPSARRARDSFEARIILESGIFTCVAEVIQEDDLDPLLEIIALEERAFDRGDRSALIRHTGEFHIALCNLLENAELTRMLRELVSRTSVALAVFPPSGFVSMDSKHHRKIVDYLVRGEAKMAIETLATTLKEVQRSIAFEFNAERKPDLSDLASQIMARAS